MSTSPISGSWLDPGAFPHCHHIALSSLGCSQVIYDLDADGDDDDNDDDGDDDDGDNDKDDDDDGGGQVQAERLPWRAVAAKNPSAKRLVGKDQWDGGIKIKIKIKSKSKDQSDGGSIITIIMMGWRYQHQDG